MGGGHSGAQLSTREGVADGAVAQGVARGKGLGGARWAIANAVCMDP